MVCSSSRTQDAISRIIGSCPLWSELKDAAASSVFSDIDVMTPLPAAAAESTSCTVSDF